jgi:two-component system nitrogen regulation response regulator GlnG
MRSVEPMLRSEMLRHFHGNQVQAKDRLGISRTTLRTKLRDLGLAVECRHALESALRDA